MYDSQQPGSPPWPSSLVKGLSLVVPVYNGSATIGPLANRLESVLVATNEPHELIFVNDGSADSSWKDIQELADRHPWIRGIDMQRNFGQHNALLAGIRAARFSTTITMDDDLQHPPEELPRLLTALTSEFDVVYATPARQTHGLARNLASRATKLALAGAISADTAGMISAWRAFRTQLRDGFSQFDCPFANIDVLLTWSTSRFSSVETRHEPRMTGNSNYSFFRLARHALNMLTGFSVLPLQLASVIGFFFTLFGLFILVYVVSRYFVFGTPTAGFPFLASIIAIFSGTQLFALGIIGEYLARMYLRSLKKPAYSIRNVINFDK